MNYEAVHDAFRAALGKEPTNETLAELSEAEGAAIEAELDQIARAIAAGSVVLLKLAGRAIELYPPAGWPQPMIYWQTFSTNTTIACTALARTLAILEKC